MIAAIACTLVLASQPAAPTADCGVTDNRCKAVRSERRAGSAPTPEQRALYLHSAHRSWLFLFDETGDSQDLCAARRSFDASLAVAGQSADQRSSFEAARGELETRERQHGVRCETPAKPRRAAAAKPAVVAPTPAPLLPADTRVAAVPTAVVQPRPDAALLPVPRRDAPVQPRVDRSHPGRGLVIAAGVTLGAGVAFMATAGALGRRMADKRSDYFAYTDMVEGFSTHEQVATAEAMMHDYKVMQVRSIGLLVAGSTAVVVAAVLAGVGGRRMARAASRTALVPVPGGLALHARF